MAWTAVTGAPRSAYESQTAAGRAAPTLSTDGVDLGGVTSITVIIEAEAAQTLSGAGSMLCYVYDSAIAAWVRCPESDLTVPAGASGLRRIAWADREVIAPRGRILYATSSVTISGGTTVVAYVLCSSGIGAGVL